MVWFGLRNCEGHEGKEQVSGVKESFNDGDEVKVASEFAEQVGETLREKERHGMKEFLFLYKLLKKKCQQWNGGENDGTANLQP